MKRTRHQLAPAMPMQQIVDRAIAGFVADGLFISRLEIVDVQQFASTSGLGIAGQQGLFLCNAHVLALASAAWFWFERLDPAAVVGHVHTVDRTKRHAHHFSNCRLRHPTFAHQHKIREARFDLWVGERPVGFLSFSMMSAGVLLGAPTPLHTFTSKPGTKSLTVGMSGKPAQRVALVTANGRSLPALMYSIEVDTC